MPRLVMESNRIGPIIGDRLQCNDGEAVTLYEGEPLLARDAKVGLDFGRTLCACSLPHPNSLHWHPDAGGYCAARCQAELGVKGGQSGRSPTLRSELGDLNGALSVVGGKPSFG